MKGDFLIEKEEDKLIIRNELEDCSESNIKQYLEKKKTDSKHLGTQFNEDKEHDAESENSNNEESYCTTSKLSGKSNDYNMNHDRYEEISEQRSRHKMISAESYSQNKNNLYLVSQKDKESLDKNVSQSIDKLSYEIQKELQSVFTSKESVTEKIVLVPQKSLFATSSEGYDLSESQSTPGGNQTEFFQFRKF